MDKATDWDLASLISPVDVHEFIADHWGRAHLVVRRDSPSYFKSLAGISDLDSVLARSGARQPRVRLVRDGSVIGPDKLMAPGALPVGASVDTAIRELLAGATIALHFVQEELPTLATLCEALRIELSCSAQVNVYLTPPHSRGLKPHPDNHDVFVIQLAGRKHWTLYTLSAEGEVEPSEDFHLESGDLLYLPRGLIHDAVSEESFSAHLTIGMSPLTMGDLLLMEVGRVLGSDDRFNPRLPSGLAVSQEAQEELAARLSSSLAEMTDAVDIPAVVADAVAQLARVQRFFPSGGLEGAIDSFQDAPPRVEVGQVWRLQQSCLVHDLEGGGVAITRNGWQTNFPPSVGWLVQDLATREGHRVSDTGASTDWEVGAVIDRMLAEGLVERLATTG
jgi:hypothetical protein